MRKIISVLLFSAAFSAVSLSVPGCTTSNPTTYDTITNTIIVQDTTRNAMGINNPVTVYIGFMPDSVLNTNGTDTVGTNVLDIYANGQLVATPIYYTNSSGTVVVVPDSIIIPDSANLFAEWTTHKDSVLGTADTMIMSFPSAASWSINGGIPAVSVSKHIAAKQIESAVVIKR
jgi:hypothetical protein